MLKASNWASCDFIYQTEKKFSSSLQLSNS